MRKLTALLPLFLAVSAGCQNAQRTVNPGDRPPTFYEDINCITLMLTSPLLDVDGDKIPDGAAFKIYLNRPNQPDFIAGRGSLVLHMYKSVRTPDGKIDNTELKSWPVDGEKFRGAVVRQEFGLISHNVAVYWPDTIPRGSGIYIQAEFIRTDGQHIWSRSISLPVALDGRRTRP